MCCRRSRSAPGSEVAGTSGRHRSAAAVSGVRTAWPGKTGLLDVAAANELAATIPDVRLGQPHSSASIGAAHHSARPALITVAHGSRDPRSAETVSAVVAALAAERPDIDVRLAFLDLSAPSVDQVVAAVAARGHTHAVVAPLLLGSAFHARVDLPGLLAAASARHPLLRLTRTEVLGPDTRLIAALRDRVSVAALGLTSPDAMRALTDRRPHSRAGVSPLVANAVTVRRLGVAVAAVGSSSTEANARTAVVARRLASSTGWRTEICFATTEPTVTEAVSRLRAKGSDHILVAPWFLAPGLLTDRLVATAPDLLHADVIGSHPALTEIVWDRYDAAIAEGLTLSA